MTWLIVLLAFVSGFLACMGLMAFADWLDRRDALRRVRF